ncbi:hypothetical protein AAVH_30902, partial [Aphelenchoides avenae]
QVWMHDASKHTQTQLEHERQKYRKLRDDHNVPDLEARALERLKDIRNAINNALEEYNDQRTSKRPENSQPRLSLLGPLSKLEAADLERRNADESDQPRVASDANLQDLPNDEVRDPSDQFCVDADVKLQDPPSGEASRVTADAAPNESDQCKTVADREPCKADQSIVVADVRLQGPPHGQYDQSNKVADVKLQCPPSGAVRGLTDAVLHRYGQSDQPNAVADVYL